MIIVKVIKPLVSTNRIPDFEHKHLQVVLDGSSKKVAVDAVGAKPGDWVICVGSSAAREAAGSKSYPSDLTIVGIIDHWDPDAPQSAAASCWKSCKWWVHWCAAIGSVVSITCTCAFWKTTKASSW